ncbi:hypothetical protein [Spirochaeta africana]|uniref:Uncharacterized protein n=1 Tax=Spirochaeta africana (strain ATCC 700263 / DSM 8902 / Z-7692) TaxID=889378 RepID=H9UIV9_SPIAZ|nr:hypothetical protein [Spirochaeta africana]AFG37452.1 hypothetical protein Spiaf_1386 [Spirochaeta africana DSM 8902]
MDRSATLHNTGFQQVLDLLLGMRDVPHAIMRVERGDGTLFWEGAAMAGIIKACEGVR